MSHPVKGRSTRNAMPWDFTCGFPTIKLDACRGISTVVGTKARGYTVTRKIVPATGPKSHSNNISNFKECWLLLVFALLELCWCCCQLWCRCRCVEGNSGCICGWLYYVFFVVAGIVFSCMRVMAKCSQQIALWNNSFFRWFYSSPHFEDFHADLQRSCCQQTLHTKLSRCVLQLLLLEYSNEIHPDEMHPSGVWMEQSKQPEYVCEATSHEDELGAQHAGRVDAPNPTDIHILPSFFQPLHV